MSLTLRNASRAAPLVTAPVGNRLPLSGMLPTPLAMETERQLAGRVGPGGQGGGSPAPAPTPAPTLMRPGGQILTRRAEPTATIVRTTASPIVTTAPAPAPIVRAAIPPIVTTEPARVSMVPTNAILTKSEPMSLALRSSQTSVGTVGPGLGGAVRAVGGAVLGAATSWAVGQITGSRTAGPGSASPPSIPMPSTPGPSTMGVGASIGRAGAAVGTVVGRIAGSKKVRGVVGGILGWWLIDKATGAILGQTTPPSRRMNVLNLRALRRADRRVDGFVKIARKALSSTGFKVERRGKSCAPKRRKCR